MGQSVVMKTKTVALTPAAGARGSTRRPSRSRTRRGPADIGRAIITLAITTASTTQAVTALGRDIVQPSTEPDPSIQSGTVKLTGTRARAIAIMSGSASMSQTHAPDADSRHARARLHVPTGVDGLTPRAYCWRHPARRGQGRPGYEEDVMKQSSRRVTLVALLLLTTCARAWAQLATAQMNGRVTDESGAVLPGVTITATQTDTGATRTVVTDAGGSYVLTNLPTGPYRLEAMLSGFRAYVQTGIVLQVASAPVINIALALGNLE